MLIILKIVYRYPMWTISFVCYRSPGAIKSNYSSFLENNFWNSFSVNRGNGAELYNNVFVCPPQKCQFIICFSSSIWRSVHLISAQHVSQGKNARNSNGCNWCTIFTWLLRSPVLTSTHNETKNAIEFPCLVCDIAFMVSVWTIIIIRWKCHRESDNERNWKWLLCCLHKNKHIDNELNRTPWESWFALRGQNEKKV